MEFDSRLDVQADINVRAPLLLMELAEKCHNFQAFCHVSTLFALCERTGFIDERMYESDHDWHAEYERITQMSPTEVVEQQKRIIGKFPNNYCYTKRMAEELLVSHQRNQKKPVPLVIVRPSIIAASFEEPVPGWTDSLGLLGGFYAIAGHGILRDLPLNPKLIADQIPVDFVSNQLLAAIPVCVQ